jgi:hypothetical protein
MNGSSQSRQRCRCSAAFSRAPDFGSSTYGFSPSLRWLLAFSSACQLWSVVAYVDLGRYPHRFAADRPGSTRWHAVEFRHRVEVVDPCLLRANKYLPPRQQFISLPYHSKPHVVGFWLIASRCRINRRPALRAESLQTDGSTFGGLSIFRRLAGQKHERAWMSDDDRSQWSAAHNLAICAVANGRRFGIGFGLEPH